MNLCRLTCVVFLASALGAPAASAKPCRGKNKIARLLCKVESRSTRTRGRAVAALEKLGPQIADELVKTVATRVDIGKGGTDEKVVAAISGLVPTAGPAAVNGILALMKRDDNDFSFAVFAVLMPQAGKIVAPLTRALADPSPVVRQNAAEVVGRAGPSGAPAVPALVKALGSDKNTKVRRAAAEALGRIGVASPKVVPALTRALKDNETDVIKEAIEALRRFGPKAESAAGALLKLVSKRGARGYRISLALHAMGPATVPRLVKALRSASPKLHSVAIETLKQLGPGAKAAVKPLTAHLRRTRKGGLAGLEALTAMGGPRAARPTVPLVTPLLKDKDWVTRVQAADALGKLGPSASAAVPPLTVALADKSQPFANRVRASSAKALGNIGAAAGPGVSALREALSAKDWQIRENAITALGQIGKPALSALPELRKLAKDRAANIRRTAKAAVKLLEAAK